MQHPSYLAGFFDGEGSIGVYRGSNGAFFLRTQLTQVQSGITRSLLDSFRKDFGGSISHQTTPSGRGKLNWQLNSDSAAYFLSVIEPHLFLKREQAQLAIWWQANRQRSSVRTPEALALNEETVIRMAALKRAA